MKEYSYNDVVIKVGQCDQENWELIDFESNYIWLHLNSFPSCHVIIYDDNPTNELLSYAADLCKNNTKYKNLKHLKVCYTKCCNLQKGHKIGSVTYKSNRQVKTITL